jgi:hypothetical protein
VPKVPLPFITSAIPVQFIAAATGSWVQSLYSRRTARGKGRRTPMRNVALNARLTGESCCGPPATLV